MLIQYDLWGRKWVLNTLYLNWRIQRFNSVLQISQNKLYISMVESVLNTPFLYFSYSYDITHTMQRLHNITPEFLQVCFFGCITVTSKGFLLKNTQTQHKCWTGLGMPDIIGMFTTSWCKSHTGSECLGIEGGGDLSWGRCEEVCNKLGYSCILLCWIQMKYCSHAQLFNTCHLCYMFQFNKPSLDIISQKF